MKNYIYSLPTIGPSQNIQLIYNFDNISINTPETSTELTSTNALSNIHALFPSFHTTNYKNTIYNSFAINTQSTNQQVSYSDSITLSPIQYTIKYLHVGVSPIQFDTTSTFAIIIDCIDSTGNILLIIIPLKKSIDSKYTENAQITALLTNIDITTSVAPFDIGQIIQPSLFNTYTSGTNRVILFNDSSISYKTIPTFMDTATTKNIKVAILNTTLPNTYKSLSIPQKKNVLVQNDIYIDCYKVGETNNINGGVINTDPQTIATKRNRSNTRRNRIIFYILISLVGISILVISFIYIFKMISPKIPTPEIETVPVKSKPFFSLF